jgi:2-polyprenyl-6-methoxyphenol hydroxylase-like FAD-dependent oxidoreductase
LPNVYQALLAAGIGELRLIDHMPGSIADRSPRAGDDELLMLTSRRHTLDRVLVEAARATAGVELRFGATATGLLTEDDHGQVPRVHGVRLADGQQLRADLVLDASGRRSRVPRWLAADGIELPLEAWDCGLIYFTRHYRLRPGTTWPPLNRVFSAGVYLPSAMVALFPGDNATTMVSIVVLAEDALLKSVGNAESFERVARAVPSIAPWMECMDPISPVYAMGALKNTLRRSVSHGRLLVSGLHLVGDAACTTNPTLGRGVSFAAAYARCAADVIATDPEEVDAQAFRLDAFVTRDIEPRFRENARFDRARVASMRADLAGEPPPAPPPAAADRVGPTELLAASFQDADVFRAQMQYAQLLVGEALLTEPWLVERVRTLVPPDAPPPMAAGPTRKELATLLSAPTPTV